MFARRFGLVVGGWGRRGWRVACREGPLPLRLVYVTIVRALGDQPRYQRAELMVQAADLLAAEVAERHRRVVLIVDEAHLLEPAQLEELRLLTNADMDSASAFAGILVGQPTLNRQLRMGTFAALDQRVAARFTLRPMDLAESARIPQTSPRPSRTRRTALRRRRRLPASPRRQRPAPAAQQRRHRRTHRRRRRQQGPRRRRLRQEGRGRAHPRLNMTTPPRPSPHPQTPRRTVIKHRCQPVCRQRGRQHSWLNLVERCSRI